MSRFWRIFLFTTTPTCICVNEKVNKCFSKSSQHKSGHCVNRLILPLTSKRWLAPWIHKGCAMFFVCLHVCSQLWSWGLRVWPHHYKDWRGRGQTIPSFFFYHERLFSLKRNQLLFEGGNLQRYKTPCFQLRECEVNIVLSNAKPGANTDTSSCQSFHIRESVRSREPLPSPTSVHSGLDNMVITSQQTASCDKAKGTLLQPVTLGPNAPLSSSHCNTRAPL